MCSLRFSPVPTPNQKRPGSMSATVAAAWARIAGWMRTLSAVTPVPIVMRSVEAAMPPSTDHTNGLSPWRSVHGWKWSEIIAKSNPTSSARRALAMRASGRCSSLERA
jgi:hypothetical protein